MMFTMWCSPSLSQPHEHSSPPRHLHPSSENLKLFDTEMSVPVAAATLIQRVAEAMERIAPLRLADTTWDNVGVLVENPKPNNKKRVMLTIDLTPAVLQECIERHVEVIVAYHPPIFSSWKKLTLRNTKQQIILTAIAEGMSVFSPHTSLDAAQGGMNDWLAALIDKEATALPITPSEVSKDGAPMSTGMGRYFTLTHPQRLEDLVHRVKTGLNIPTVRVSLPQGWDKHRQVSSVAVCAGSGSSVFRQLKKPVEVLVSGEMGHHDVLAAADNGQVVILCEHTNTERGFLERVLLPTLSAYLGSDVEVLVAAKDADPLIVW